MHLMIVLDDRLSDWEAKGEVLRGYFNPDGVFSRITVISLLKDTPSHEVLSTLTAPAAVDYFSLGFRRLDMAIGTFGLSKYRLRALFAPLFKIVQRTRPNLLRAFGESMGTVAASYVKKELGVPYVVSLHQTPAPHIVRRYLTTKDRLWRNMMKRNVRRALVLADGVIAVYSPILAYLPREVRARAVVIPNVVAAPRPTVDRPPEPGAGRKNLSVVWVSRLIKGRDPRPVLEAVARLDGVTLTIIGDGPLRADVEHTIEKLGLNDRVRLIPSMKNTVLVNALPTYDVMALRTQFLEISKPVLEAGLAGLPVVINSDPCAGISEYTKLPLLLVEDNAAAYAKAFEKLHSDEIFRAAMSKAFKEHAWRRWAPEKICTQTADFLTTKSR